MVGWRSKKKYQQDMCVTRDGLHAQKFVNHASKLIFNMIGKANMIIQERESSILC